jgi:hypothetical protein
MCFESGVGASAFFLRNPLQVNRKSVKLSNRRGAPPPRPMPTIRPHPLLFLGQKLEGSAGGAGDGERPADARAHARAIMRFPSKGISPGGCIRGSAMTFALPASRASRDGHTIQEKTTVSPGSSFTAIGKEVSLPSGTSSPQHSTPSTPPPPARRARGRSAPPSPPGRGRLGAGRRHRDQKSVDIGHGILPPEVSAPSLADRGLAQKPERYLRACPPGC